MGKKGFFEKLGDAVSSIDMNAPGLVIGGTAKENAEVFAKYKRAKEGGAEIHLHKHYVIVNKKGEKLLDIDPEEMDIIEAECEEIEQDE